MLGHSLAAMVTTQGAQPCCTKAGSSQAGPMGSSSYNRADGLADASSEQIKQLILPERTSLTVLRLIAEQMSNTSFGTA